MRTGSFMVCILKSLRMVCDKRCAQASISFILDSTEKERLLFEKKNACL